MFIVVICFQISIFEPLETTDRDILMMFSTLWFAFKLVSLNHWKQPIHKRNMSIVVVICFQISIFEPLETTKVELSRGEWVLWFAFKLVSLNHWKQLINIFYHIPSVVICFQISIFEPLETTLNIWIWLPYLLWFAFKLVSLNHWKQRRWEKEHEGVCCDLLSN